MSLAGGQTVAAAVTDARGMTKRGFARLPGRGDAGRTELAERLLASQRTFAGDVLCATTPMPPARAAPAPARGLAAPSSAKTTISITAA